MGLGCRNQEQGKGQERSTKPASPAVCQPTGRSTSRPTRRPLHFRALSAENNKIKPEAHGISFPSAFFTLCLSLATSKPRNCRSFPTTLALLCPLLCLNATSSHSLNRNTLSTKNTPNQYYCRATLIDSYQLERYIQSRSTTRDQRFHRSNKSTKNHLRLTPPCSSEPSPSWHSLPPQWPRTT